MPDPTDKKQFGVWAKKIRSTVKLTKQGENLGKI